MCIRKSQAPTLVDVARAASVSLKTASRVLNAIPGPIPGMVGHQLRLERADPDNVNTTARVS